MTTIKRIVATTALVLAAAAPAAQARPAVDVPQSPPSKAPVSLAGEFAKSGTPAVATDYAQMAAAREAVTQRHYELANQAPRPVTPVATQPDDGGFPWTAASGLALLPALLIVGVVFLRPAFRRRSRIRIAG